MRYSKVNRRPRLNCCDDYEIDIDDYLDDSNSEEVEEDFDIENTADSMNTSEMVNQVTDLNISDQEQQRTDLDDSILEDVTMIDYDIYDDIHDDIHDDITVLTQNLDQNSTDTTDIQSKIDSFDQVLIENTHILSKEDDVSLVLVSKCDDERDDECDDECDDERDNERDNEGKEEEQKSDSSYHQDDWDLLTAIQNMKSSFSVKNDSDWDAISSIQSVVTMDTFHSEVVKNMSYKDVLAKKQASISVVGNGVNGVKHSKKQSQTYIEEIVSPSSIMIPIIEDNCRDGCYDAFAEREGYKYSRGGKKKFMFCEKKPRKLKSGQKAGRKS